MSETEINIETAINLGLSKKEFKKIQDILNRTPNLAELNLFSSIWSGSNQFISLENILNSLAFSKSIQLTDELSCILKIDNINCCLADAKKSDSSDSQAFIKSSKCLNSLYSNILIEGASPLAVLTNFNFGPLEQKSTKIINEGIQSASSYINTFGSPLVGLHANFEDYFNSSHSISTLMVGVIKNSRAPIPVKLGNKILFVAEVIEKDILNPLYQKTIQGAISEITQDELAANIQSIGKGALFSGLIMLLNESKYGIQFDLSEVPNTNNSHSIVPELNFAIAIVAKKDKEKKIKEILKKWELNFHEAGEIIKKKNITIINNKVIHAEIPIKAFKARNQSIAKEDIEEIETFKKESFHIDQIPEPENLRDVAWLLLKHPNIASNHWITEQYDTTVGTNNMSTNFPSSATIVNLKGTEKALTLAFGANPKYMSSNFEIGTQITFAELSRKVVCAGARPVAASVCFDLMKNEDLNQQQDLTKMVKGLNKVSAKFNTSIIDKKIKLINNSHGENCSFANIGILGILEDKNHQMTISFKNKGNIIFLIGYSKEDISSSEYLHSYHQVKNSPPPFFDLNMECETQNTIQELITKNYVCSVHGVAKGGLFISLVESAMVFGLGFDIITDTDIRTDAFLFGESQGRIIVSITPNKESNFIDFMMKEEVPFLALGHVTKGEMRIDDISFGFINDAKRDYDNALEKRIKNKI